MHRAEECLARAQWTMNEEINEDSCNEARLKLRVNELGMSSGYPFALTRAQVSGEHTRVGWNLPGREAVKAAPQGTVDHMRLHIWLGALWMMREAWRWEHERLYF